MPMISEMPLGKRWRRRDLIAGVVGLAAAAALMVCVLLFQDYSSRTFLLFSLFIFPAPVACGLAIGMVSPRKAIVWAPLWAAISAVFLFAIISGCIRNVSEAYTPTRVAVMIAGVVVAAFTGFVGQSVSSKGYKGIAIALFILLCAGASVGQMSVVRSHTREFERVILPRVTAEIDEDFLRLPHNLQWSCTRCPKMNCYELTASIDDRPVFVRVDSVVHRIIGMRYEIADSKKQIKSDAAARIYLERVGFQDKLLSSLERADEKKCVWTASLNETHLKLSQSGEVKIDFLER